MTLENDENKTYTNNPDSVPAAGTLQGGSDTTPGNNENENEGFMNNPEPTNVNMPEMFTNNQEEDQNQNQNQSF